MWFIALMYFLPTMWALYKGHPNLGTIFAVNLILGWTPVWFVLLFVADYKGPKIAPIEPPKTAAPVDFKCRYAAAIKDEISTRLGEHRHDNEDFNDAEEI